MKRIGGMLLGVTAVFLFLVPPAQGAMRVIVARMLGGQVQVVGFQAARKAPILWQGSKVTTSTLGGTFFFYHGAVPVSCVGELSDGVETAYISVQNCVPTGVNLAVTGQTTSQSAGDDGAVRAGFPFPSPRFTVNGDGTVTDNLTGLIWLQDANCPNDTRTWEEALGDVAELNADGTMNTNDCGDASNGGTHQTDWRLPNRNELASLLDLGFFAPALSNAAGTTKWTTDGDAFIGLQPVYWTSTAYAYTDSTERAWTVSFIGGGMFPIDTTKDLFVFPVRGGL